MGIGACVTGEVWLAVGNWSRSAVSSVISDSMVRMWEGLIEFGAVWLDGNAPTNR